MSYKRKNILFGLLLVAVGIGFLGDQLDWWTFHLFFPGWWTLILILPAISGIYHYGVHMSNIVVGLVGVYYLLEANDLIYFTITWQLMVAMLCIAFGIKLLFTRRRTYYEHKSYKY